MTHARQLAEYLKIVAAGPAERKDRIEKLPKTLSAYDMDGKVVNVRELLTTEAIETTPLVQTEFYNTVMEGAEPAKVFRNILPIFRCNGATLRVPLGESGTYADIVAEGAQVPEYDQDYGHRDFTIQKLATRPMISQELVDDAMFDVVAMEISKSGARIENALNQLCLNSMLDNAGLEYDTAQTTELTGPMDAAASAIGLIRAQNFAPDTIIMHPSMEKWVLKEMVPSNYWLGDKIASTGVVPTLLGCKVAVTAIADSTSSYVWGFGTDGYIEGLVLDSKNAGAIAMRQDITVNRYNDPIRDLVGATVKMRVGVNYLYANAICRIEY